MLESQLYKFEKKLSMKKEQKEKIAISAANIWCRCFKCDGKVNATGYICDQDKKLTCHKWYDGYRTAMLALNEYEQQIMNTAINGEIKMSAPECEGHRGDFWIESRFLTPHEAHEFVGNDKIKIAIIKTTT